MVFEITGRYGLVLVCRRGVVMGCRRFNLEINGNSELRILTSNSLYENQV
jgi:hypothetical protein